MAIAFTAICILFGCEKKTPIEETANTTVRKMFQSIIDSKDTSLSNKIIAYKNAEQMLFKSNESTDIQLLVKVLSKIVGVDSTAEMIKKKQYWFSNYSSYIAYKIEEDSVLHAIQTKDSTNAIWFWRNKTKFRELFFREIKQFSQNGYRIHTDLNLLFTQTKDTAEIRTLVSMASDSVLYHVLSDLLPYTNQTRVEKIFQEETRKTNLEKAIEIMVTNKRPTSKIADMIKTRSVEIESGSEFLIFCNKAEIKDSLFIKEFLSKMTASQLSSPNHGTIRNYPHFYCELLKNKIKNETDFIDAGIFIKENLDRENCKECYDLFLSNWK